MDQGLVGPSFHTLRDMECFGIWGMEGSPPHWEIEERRKKKKGLVLDQGDVAGATISRTWDRMESN